MDNVLFFDEFCRFFQIFHDHMLHAARTHFQKGNYLKIYGSPVIFLHTLRDYVNHKECLKVTFEQVAANSL